MMSLHRERKVNKSQKGRMDAQVRSHQLPNLCISTEPHHLKYVGDMFHKAQKKKFKVNNIYSIHSTKCEIPNLLHESPGRTRVLDLTMKRKLITVAAPESSRYQVDKPGLILKFSYVTPKPPF